MAEKGIKILGTKLTGVKAERKPDFSGKLNLKTNIRIPSLEKIKNSKDSLKMGYDFEVDYDDLGSVTVSGLVFFSSDSKTIKEIQKKWDKKDFESIEFVTLTNIILKKASIKAFELEEELGLPIHIKLPQLTPKKK